MTKTKFKFPKDILNACTEYKDYSTAGVSPILVWSKDLTRKQKREIAALVKDYARYNVFAVNQTQSGETKKVAYYRLKSLSWSWNKDHPEELWATFNVLDIQEDRSGYIYLSLDESYDKICPTDSYILEHPVSVCKFKKTLSSLANRIVVKTLGKKASL